MLPPGESPRPPGQSLLASTVLPTEAEGKRRKQKNCNELYCVQGSLVCNPKTKNYNGNCASYVMLLCMKMNEMCEI
jgi:hypothetical protein